jgi:glycosyltransferase involved in cell wall biosynthesis
MKPRSRVFFVVQNEMLTGGVIEAQVIGSLRAQSRIGDAPPTTALFLEPARVAFSRRARRTLKFYRRLWPEGDIRIVPYVGRLGRDAAAMTLAAYVAALRLTRDRIAFHCRGSEAAWSAHVARRVIGRGIVVCDVRGHYPLETIHRLGCPHVSAITPRARAAYESTLRSDARAARIADRFFVVSEGLKDYVSGFGRQHSDIDVVPSCVDDLAFDVERRRRLREGWGIADGAPVFAYAGRIGPERQPLLMFTLFRAILERHAGARLLLFVYRNDLRDLHEMLQAAGVPSTAVTIERASRDHVVSCLCAADYGLLFCEPADRYASWFPIKFPEYLSAGLGVVLNDLVGALPELVRQRQIGRVIEHPWDEAAVERCASTLVEAIRHDADGIRSRALATCVEKYLWSTHVPIMRRAFGFEPTRKQEPLN